jgi:hypothetical protein
MISDSGIKPALQTPSGPAHHNSTTEKTGQPSVNILTPAYNDGKDVGRTAFSEKRRWIANSKRQWNLFPDHCEP